MGVKGGTSKPSEERNSVHALEGSMARFYEGPPKILQYGIEGAHWKSMNYTNQI